MSRAVIAKGVDTAFKEAKKISATRDVTLKTPGTGIDPTTLQPVAASITATGTGILYNYSLRQIDGVGIKAGDQGAVLRFSEFPTVTVNQVLAFDGDEWQIITANPDPTQTIWEVQLRR